MFSYRAESLVISRPDEIEPHWLALEPESDCSYFQSWGWISIWLKQIAIDLKPVLVRVWCDDVLVGMGLFVRGDVNRRGVINSKTMFLNEYPHEGNNMVIEYNGLLAMRGHEKSVYEQAFCCLLEDYDTCDEYIFSAVEESLVLRGLIGKHFDHACLYVNESSKTWYVDLASVPPRLDDYLGVFSKNRRAQIRRTINLYEKSGPLMIHEATDTEEALVYFGRMEELHTQRWQNKGLPGSFANPVWVSFHRGLIQNRFDSGEIQILEIRAGEDPIGYLYNFVWRGRAYVLQTGFKSSKDKRLMPGYVSHVLAIQYNKSKGMKAYDLMHGDSLYKRLLCNQSSKLLWMVLQRNRPKFMAERVLVSLVRSIRGLIN